MQWWQKLKNIAQDVHNLLFVMQQSSITAVKISNIKISDKNCSVVCFCSECQSYTNHSSHLLSSQPNFNNNNVKTFRGYCTCWAFSLSFFFMLGKSSRLFFLQISLFLHSIGFPRACYLFFSYISGAILTTFGSTFQK